MAYEQWNRDMLEWVNEQDSPPNQAPSLKRVLLDDSPVMKTRSVFQRWKGRLPHNQMRMLSNHIEELCRKVSKDDLDLMDQQLLDFEGDVHRAINERHRGTMRYTADEVYAYSQGVLASVERRMTCNMLLEERLIARDRWRQRSQVLWHRLLQTRRRKSV